MKTPAYPAAILFASLLGLATTSFGAVTIPYTDAEDNTADYDTSAPNDPTTLYIDTGSAIQSGILSGDGAVEKTGAGTVNLTNTNTYTGATTVSLGTLIVDGSITSNVTVVNGASFGGDGIINGDITLQSGSTLLPIDCFDADSVAWNGGATMVFHIGDSGLTDILELVNNLNKGSAGTFDFTFLDADWQTGEAYTIMTFLSTDFVESDFGYTNGGGFAGTFTLEENSLSFTVTTVPEPSTWALMILGLVLLGVEVRRRRKLSV